MIGVLEEAYIDPKRLNAFSFWLLKLAQQVLTGNYGMRSVVFSCLFTWAVLTSMPGMAGENPEISIRSLSKKKFKSWHIITKYAL